MAAMRDSIGRFRITLRKFGKLRKLSACDRLQDRRLLEHSGCPSLPSASEGLDRLVEGSLRVPHHRRNAFEGTIDLDELRHLGDPVDIGAFEIALGDTDFEAVDDRLRVIGWYDAAVVGTQEALGNIRREQPEDGHRLAVLHDAAIRADGRRPAIAVELDRRAARIKDGIAEDGDEFAGFLYREAAIARQDRKSTRLNSGH